MTKHDWKDKGSCLGSDTNLFFEKYEEDNEVRAEVDSMCAACPMAKHCFAVGVSQKEWGVWGGIYIENGKISREFSRHRSRDDWAETWKYLTLDTE